MNGAPNPDLHLRSSSLLDLLVVESPVQPVCHKLEDQDEDDEHRDVNKRTERFTGVSALDEVVRAYQQRS
jgi:hypothetical protein